MPALPSSLLEPVWDQFAALVPERPRIAPTHFQTRSQDMLMSAVSKATRHFEETRDNIAGRLPLMMRAAGFEAVREPERYRTLIGTVSLYTAHKSEAHP